MTLFEQFLWTSTYLLPVGSITSSSYETYCGSIDKWNAHSVDMPYRWLTTYGTQEMADAYRALMEWDYNYFIENGAVMNFITGKTSLENKDLNIVSKDNPNGNGGDPSQEEIDKIRDEIMGEEDKSIEGNAKNFIKDNMVIIVLLLILIGVTVGVIIYCKRKATHDDKNK